MRLACRVRAARRARRGTRRRRAPSYVLVTRYDRRRERRRSTCHDCCTKNLQFPSGARHRSRSAELSAEGGPTFAAAFDLVRRATTRPGSSRSSRSWTPAIFNVIIGNADAHGKNFSLLVRPRPGIWRRSTDLPGRRSPIQDLSPTFAMKIGGCGTLEEIGSATWPTFAQRHRRGRTIRTRARAGAHHRRARTRRASRHSHPQHRSPGSPRVVRRNVAAELSTVASAASATCLRAAASVSHAPIRTARRFTSSTSSAPCASSSAA